MEFSDDQIRRWILQILYPQTNTLLEVKPVSSAEISEKLAINRGKVEENLHYFLKKGWVVNKKRGYVLTDEAVWAISQHDRTYCPYI